jgi:hypothetical protein
MLGTGSSKTVGWPLQVERCPLLCWSGLQRKSWQGLEGGLGGAHRCAAPPKASSALLRQPSYVLLLSASGISHMVCSCMCTSGWKGKGHGGIVQTAAFCTLLTERIGEPSICISAALCSGLLAIYIRAAPGRECNRHWSCLATPRHIFEQDEAEKPARALHAAALLFWTKCKCSTKPCSIHAHALYNNTSPAGILAHASSDQIRTL